MCFNFNTNVRLPTEGDDGLCEYSVQLLLMCCLYMEFADAIREGDGGHVLLCWKYMLPIFLASGNKNYACVAANFLLQHTYLLSPRQSAQLSWSRFVNVHEQPGRNIPVDLHMEHLNKIAKDALNGLGSNKSQKSIQRIGRAIGTLSPVMDNFDAINNVTRDSSKQKKPKAKKDIQIVIKELVTAKSFVVVNKGRKHQRFPKLKNLLQSKGKEDITEWLVSKLPCSLHLSMQ